MLSTFQLLVVHAILENDVCCVTSCVCPLDALDLFLITQTSANVSEQLRATWRKVMVSHIESRVNINYISMEWLGVSSYKEHTRDPKHSLDCKQTENPFYYPNKRSLLLQTFSSQSHKIPMGQSCLESVCRVNGDLLLRTPQNQEIESPTVGVLGAACILTVTCTFWWLFHSSPVVCRLPCTITSICLANLTIWFQQ